MKHAHIVEVRPREPADDTLLRLMHWETVQGLEWVARDSAGRTYWAESAAEAQRMAETYNEIRRH